MKKGFLPLLLILVVALAFTGCGMTIHKENAAAGKQEASKTGKNT